jgi:predicted SnoaL-like aldol condensation-catalyzing enzyme
MPESNSEVFKRYMTIWTTGEIDRLDDVIAPGYVGHTGANPDLDDDLESLGHHVRGFHEANPDLVVEVEQQIAQGDYVATRMVARKVDDSKATEVRFVGFNISRFENDKIVEEWALWERP